MKKYCILTDKKKVLLQFKLDKKDRHTEAAFVHKSSRVRNQTIKIFESHIWSRFVVISLEQL